mmetsp:Transcript_75544/g.164832  ORF Transcript_75544/g.164832 Transcript_75544/m.164832 type:complete len:359 (+) Transcript_75544:985-2061(+)
MDPSVVEGALDLGQGHARLVVCQGRIVHDSMHVLEAVSARTSHFSIDRSLHSEGPSDRQSHAIFLLDAGFLLGSQNAVQGGEDGLNAAPGGHLRDALWLHLEEVRLVEENQHRHGWVPLVALLEAVPEALEGGVLPGLVAVEAGAEVRLVGHFGVVAGHHVEADFLGPVQEGSVIAVDAEAEGVVETHSAGTELNHGVQVVTAMGSPLQRVGRLHHVLRGPAVAAAVVLDAGQSAVGDAAQRLQGRELPGREGRARRAGLGLRGGRLDDHIDRSFTLTRGEVRLVVGVAEAGGVDHLLIVRSPSSSDGLGAVSRVSMQPIELRAQAMDWPLSALGCDLVAEGSSPAELPVSQAEETVI